MRDGGLAQFQGRTHRFGSRGTADQKPLLIDPLVEDPGGDLGRHIRHLKDLLLDLLELLQGVPHDAKGRVHILRQLPRARLLHPKDKRRVSAESSMSKLTAADEGEAAGSSSVSLEDDFLEKFCWAKLGLCVKDTAEEER
jgi:hypothetical protein